MKTWMLALGLALVPLATSAAHAGEGDAVALDAKTPIITVQDLKKVVDHKNATIIDANGVKMYDEGHVPGAISYAKNEGKLASLLPKDKHAEIVAYCGGPMCSAWEAAAEECQKLGYTNIKHLKAGIKGWKEAKMPVETAAN